MTSCCESVEGKNQVTVKSKRDPLCTHEAFTIDKMKRVVGLIYHLLIYFAIKS